MHDGTQDEEIQWSVSVLPGRPVQTHQDFPGWEVDQDQGQEDLRGELLVVDGAFYAPFLGFGRTGSRDVGTEISVVDTLCSDHREDEIDDALEGVNTEEGDAGFKPEERIWVLVMGGPPVGHENGPRSARQGRSGRPEDALEAGSRRRQPGISMCGRYARVSVSTGFLV
ncbi:hypothetical protein ACVWZX_004201 [Deinococcus sp. UYEF24]